LQAVATYVSKGRVIADLVDAAVLHVDNTGKLLEKWPSKEDKPPIFNLLSGETSQADVFVRWSVEIPGDPQPEVWLDRALWASWEKYYNAQKSHTSLCFVTGAASSMADQHPAKIRNDGDKAKLISSNDQSGYTFRGRFTTADEACGVGFQVTQKAHSALRWLIARQGRRDGDQAVVAWAVRGVAIPDPLVDTLALISGYAEETLPPPEGVYTAQEIGIRLANMIGGYSQTLEPTDDVVVMVLDSATPGRMAMRYYRELQGAEFLGRVRHWHETCAWLQYFGKNRIFVGAPSPRDIAETAYGRRLDDKLRKATVERLLPCIIDGTPLPPDLREACVRRASNRHGIEQNTSPSRGVKLHHWRTLLSVA